MSDPRTPSAIDRTRSLRPLSRWLSAALDRFRPSERSLLLITAIVVIMSVIQSFMTFDLVWVMTQGGPGRSSETLAVTMYRQAFIMWRMGYAGAVAVILSTIVLVFSISYLRSTLKRSAI